MPVEAAAVEGSSPHTRGAPAQPPSGAMYAGIIPAYAGSTRRRRHPPGKPQGSSPHTRGAPVISTVASISPRIIPAYAGSTARQALRIDSREDHPRIRGEHSAASPSTSRAAGSSPHTRGAPLDLFRALAVRRIIPAYAGSTGPSARTRSGAGDHPRIRGEHGSTARIRGFRVGSSPHTRGALGDAGGGSRRRGIIPAYAGSTFPAGWMPGDPRDHPRIRGEHLRPIRSSSPYNGSSPHTRGAPGSTARRRCTSWIIPAYAGSTAQLFGIDLLDRGSSPHTRGALAGRLGAGPVGRIIPAYAGSTTTASTSNRSRRDHPRIRGEHSTPIGPRSNQRGSSPHTRGARLAPRDVSHVTRIIPAYAGSTSIAECSTIARRDHPRIRGEHEGLGQWCRRDTGSSPHTRGAQVAEFQADRRLRIIPAYAGSTPFTASPPHAVRDHPRIRGEHTCRSSPLLTPGGSSPHTRGAHLQELAVADAGRIIPAYAGSTSNRPVMAVFPAGSSPHTRGARKRLRIDDIGPPDHPRIRGEHVPKAIFSPKLRGSSPHTRGALSPCGIHHAGTRIIPAYAGSTTSTASTPPWRRDHPRIRGEHHRPFGVPRRPSGSSPHTRGARGTG